MAKGKLYGVILAGGVGSRFWPLSRVSAPKQLLEVAGPDSLLKGTIKRLSPLIPTERIAVVTSQKQAEITRIHLNYSDAGKRRKGGNKRPAAPTKTKQPELIIEPSGRNTAPAIGLTALELIKRDPEAVMVVLPTDQFVLDGGLFRNSIKKACAFVKKHPTALVTVGIKPTYASSSFGYIKAADGGKDGVCRVSRFIEKPVRAKARLYVRDKNFLWNAGMFIWRADTVLAAFKRYCPGNS